eukprot:2903641-Prymnesium_polylepis.1
MAVVTCGTPTTVGAHMPAVLRTQSAVNSNSMCDVRSASCSSSSSTRDESVPAMSWLLLRHVSLEPSKKKQLMKSLRACSSMEFRLAQTVRRISPRLGSTSSTVDNLFTSSARHSIKGVCHGLRDDMVTLWLLAPLVLDGTSNQYRSVQSTS